ncbi:MAG: hypothetical protein ACR2GW_07035 [Pyrinomonadaceae bacterium]
MQASALTMGELGKTKKVKAPKAVKFPTSKKFASPTISTKLNLPSQAWVPNSYDPPPIKYPSGQLFSLAPPSGAPVIDQAHVQGYRDPQQPGQGKFSQITNLIGKGLDTVLTLKTGGYQQQGYPDPNQPPPNPNQPPPNPNQTSATKNLGEGVDSLLDSIGKSVKENPLLFGGLLLGGVLLFASPPKRGR